MSELLKKTLECTNVVVKDVSGGCGAMYELEVESPKFKGLSLVKQHKLVTDVSFPNGSQCCESVPSVSASTKLSLT